MEKGRLIFFAIFCASFLYMPRIFPEITIRNYSLDKPLRIQIALDSDRRQAIVPGNHTDVEIKVPAAVVERDVTIEPVHTYSIPVSQNRTYFISIANYGSPQSSQITVQVKDGTELCVEDLGDKDLAIIREVEIVNKTPHTSLIDLSFITDKYGFVHNQSHRHSDEEPLVYQRITGERAMFTRKLGLFPVDKKASTGADNEYVNGILHYTYYPFCLRFVNGYVPHNCILKACLVNSSGVTIHKFNRWTDQNLFPFSGNKTILELREPDQAPECTDIDALKVIYTRLGYREKAKHPPLTSVAPYLAVTHVSGQLPPWHINQFK